MNEIEERNAEENVPCLQECGIASDEEVAEISRMILERNKAAYKELAK
ncbi:MAG: hypothetical protein K2I95_01560 [Treponemataceae bacterium]|nr:hypothetical protein [Treponemataceae bacterium]